MPNLDASREDRPAPSPGPFATDDTRYALTGLLSAFKDGKLVIVATDGRRMALMEAQAERPAP